MWIFSRQTYSQKDIDGGYSKKVIDRIHDQSNQWGYSNLDLTLIFFTKQWPPKKRSLRLDSYVVFMKMYNKKNSLADWNTRTGVEILLSRALEVSMEVDELVAQFLIYLSTAILLTEFFIYIINQTS